MKKFGRLNGRKAERGKASRWNETRRSEASGAKQSKAGRNKRNARLAQGTVKFSSTQETCTKSCRTRRKFTLRRKVAIKFYADFSKEMKFRAGFRHWDFGKIVKFHVEFRRGFDVTAKSYVEFRQG